MGSYTDVHHFIDVLNELMDERFPETERYLVSGGDYIKDEVFEIRQSGHSLQYSPMEMFSSGKWEEAINELFERWEMMLNEK